MKHKIYLINQPTFLWIIDIFNYIKQIKLKNTVLNQIFMEQLHVCLNKQRKHPDPTLHIHKKHLKILPKPNVEANE
jgi:hypothetical protein